MQVGEHQLGATAAQAVDGAQELGIGTAAAGTEVDDLVLARGVDQRRRCGASGVKTPALATTNAR